MHMKRGIYRHYKGKRYEVIATAKHTETHELYVVYRPLEGKKQLWVRPKTMFQEYVVHEGKRVRRFTLWQS
ncbi:DUF1653 domain-containing protein [Candidatus Peregrinibacteria bacterium]|nr:DUF1653 domain-containing protein [Candidatus Peregrinibacteria bacterium]